MQVNKQIDTLDKKLLNEIQWVFPLTERPFLEISKRYNVSEDEIIHRIAYMKYMGLIRQISAIFDTRRLGYKSALIAFAIAVPPDGDLKTDLDRMASLDGVIKYRLLPTLKLYKIGVRLDMVNEDPENPKPTDEIKKLNPKRFDLTDRDKDFIRQLQKDLRIIPEPFEVLAQNLRVTTTELFAKAKEYEQIGVMRRFAAILRHRDAGFFGNGMVVWNVREEDIDEIGYKLASFPQVSHCYRRPVYQDWQFNLFSMIHARTSEAAEKIAAEMSEVVGIKDYRILFSLREFKKERVRYFEENS